MHEISGAIIAITFLMAAVFIPVAFHVGTGGDILPSVFHYDGNSHYSFRYCGIDAYPCIMCMILLKNHGKSQKKMDWISSWTVLTMGSTSFQEGIKTYSAGLLAAEW
jgi:hypothetical protein